MMDLPKIINPKKSTKVHERFYKYVTLEGADEKFLKGIILRYRREGLRSGIMSIICVLAAYLCGCVAINTESHVQFAVAVLACVVLFGFAGFIAAVPTANLARDALDARYYARRQVEIVDEDELI